ncbi:MAG: chaperone modulator CbpM [Thiomonas sp.]|jgi:chaperone modulatory protein CbpM
MNTASHTVVPLCGTVVEEQSELGLDELCAVCRVERRQIVHLVEEGVIDPLPAQGGAASQPLWRFSGESATRARRALRLQRELDLDPAAAALVLDLLDQIATLRRALYGRADPRPF